MSSTPPLLTPPASTNSCAESMCSYRQPSLTHSYADSTPSCTSGPDFDDYLHERSLSSCGASIASELQPSVDDTSDTEGGGPLPPSKSAQIRFVEPAITRSQQSLRLSGMKKRAQRKMPTEGWTSQADDDYGALEFPRVPHRSLPGTAHVYEQWNVDTLDLEDLLTLKSQNRVPLIQHARPSIRVVHSAREVLPGQPLGLELECLAESPPKAGMSAASPCASSQESQSLRDLRHDGIDGSMFSYLENVSVESVGSHRRIHRHNSISSQHSSIKEMDPRDLIDRIKARSYRCGLEAELSDPDEGDELDPHRSANTVRAEDLPPLLSTHYMNSKEFSGVATSERSRLACLPERRLAVPDSGHSRSLRLLRKNKSPSPALPSYEPVSILRAEAAFLHQETVKQAKSKSKKSVKDLYTGASSHGSARTAASSSTDLSNASRDLPPSSLRSSKSQNLKASARP